MSRYYRRLQPGLGENLRAGLVAGAIAGAAGAVAFYLARLILSRERMEPLELESGGTSPGGEPEESEG